MSNPFWKPRASASHNGDFISIETYSGYGIAIADPEASEHLLTPDVSEEVLGISILAALSASRIIDPDDDEFFDNNRIDQHYKNWIQKMMELYGYKTKRALFKNMMSCGIQLDEGMITIRPSNHEKLEAWDGGGIKPEEYVKISADSPPEEIGAALKLAFKRCRGPKPEEYK